MPKTYKIILVIIILSIFGLVVFSVYDYLDFSFTKSYFLDGHNKKFIRTKFEEMGDYIEELAEEREGNFLNSSQEDYIQAGIVSHHLPTAAPLITDFYLRLKYSQGPREIFFVIGPDHFERGKAVVSTANLPFLTPFGKLDIDEAVIKDLLKTGVAIDNEAIQDHSIGVQAIFIKKFFPKARIVPLILKANTNDEIIKKIAEVIARYRDRATVVISVDFSHYQPYDYAEILDGISEEMIKDLNFNNFTLRYVDSPASMKLLGLVVNDFDLGLRNIIRSNSYKFTGDSQNTTGYIIATFGKSNSEESLLMFVGDIMLSRSVGLKMKRENNWKWPFLKIADYLKRADILFSNLENPISIRGKNIGSIYSFRADPRVVEGLKYAGFDVLSLANNHITDWSMEAMKDTFQILKDNDISYIGAGYNRAEVHTPVVKVLKDGTKIGFLGYTNLISKYWEAQEDRPGVAYLRISDIKKDIAEAKKTVDLLVVSMHFGTEYKPHSNETQQEFARAAIDAGADIVVGHHPHVLQEIEKYKDGYIVYSLGNFVFDQLFSDDVRTGGILEVIVKNKKIKKIELKKTWITENFQVELMEK